MVDLFVDYGSRFRGVLAVALCEEGYVPALVHLLLLLLGEGCEVKLLAKPFPPLVVNGFKQGDVGGDAGVECEVGDTGHPDIGARGVALVQIGLSQSCQRVRQAAEE